MKRKIKDNELKLYQFIYERLKNKDTFSVAFVLETFVDNLGYKATEYLEKFKKDRIFRVVEIKKFLEENYIDAKYYKYQEENNLLKRSSYLDLMNEKFNNSNN